LGRVARSNLRVLVNAASEVTVVLVTIWRWGTRRRLSIVRMGVVGILRVRLLPIGRAAIIVVTTSLVLWGRRIGR
jgi:hypothetical protein